MHPSSLDKLAVFRSSYLAPYENQSLEILDVGSATFHGQAVNKGLLSNPKWNYRGLDMIEGPNVDVCVTEAYDWREVPTASVDVVVCSQVFEHARYVWITASEIARVLKPRGLAFIIAPSGGQVHRYPDDCWRFYPDGLPALMDYAGLNTIEAHRQHLPVYRKGNHWRDALVVAQKPERSTEEEQLALYKNALAKAALLAKTTASITAATAAQTSEASVIAAKVNKNAFTIREQQLSTSYSWRLRHAWLQIRQGMSVLLKDPIE